MDSLDLIRAFLEENGVEAERTIIGTDRPGTALWLPNANTHIHITLADPTLASIMALGERVFDLHDPASLPDVLECVLELELERRVRAWTVST